MTEEEIKQMKDELENRDINNFNNKNKQNSVENSSARSLAELINDILSGDNTAFVELTTLAGSGNAVAQYNLGLCYLRGDGVEQDYKQAVYWYKKAAEQGFAVAQNSLAICYYNGERVEQDYKQAVYWYNKAVEQGFVEAQNNLALCYDFGRGVEQDHKQAVYWYKKAAEQGYALAQFNLACCCDYGNGLEQDYKQAVYWYKKAAEQGEVGAQNNLGRCYYNGRGVEQDHKQAVYWFTKAAEKGITTAQNNLALCYYNGKGIEQDYDKAVFWFKKSAEQNDAGAQYYLGECYCYGYGVEKDYNQAEYWYKKAEAQGNLDARLKLLTFVGFGLSNDLSYVEKAAQEGYEEAQIALKEIKENERRQNLLSLAEAEKQFSIANAGSPHDVFISWNHADKQFKDSLVEGIEGEFSKSKKIYAHYRAWESDRDAEGDIEECIKNAIEQSKFFVLMLSKNSVQSEWVKKEVEFALKKVDAGEWTKNNIIVICLNSLGFDAGRYLSKIQFDTENIFSEIAGYAANFDGIFIKSSAKAAKSKTVENVCQRITNGLEAETVKKYVNSQTSENNSFEFTLKGQLMGGADENFVNAIMPMDGGYIERNLYGADGKAVTAGEIMQSEKSAFITGEGGTGKSLYISSVIKNYFSRNASFFIRINLLNYVKELDECHSLTDILNAEINGVNGADGYKPQGSFFRARGRGKGNRMVIVLDGLDEILNKNCDKLISLTQDYLKKYPEDRFIITARTAARFNDFNGVFRGNLNLYELKGLSESEQSLLYDNILKANEKFKISAVNERGAELKNEFFVRLENLSDDIRKNPFLLSNLIFIYLRSNGDKFPKTGYEIISRSVGIFLECSEKSKPAFNDFALKDYLSGSKLDKMLGYIACQKVLMNSGKSLEELIIQYLSISGCEAPEQTGKALYDYLCKRSIVTSDKITHDIFTSFFACGYLYNLIYKKTSTEKIDEDFIAFADEKYFEKQLANGGFFARADGSCPEVAAELIMKLDYEIHSIDTEAEMNSKHLSYNAFHKTLENALKERGFSQTAIEVVAELAKKQNGLFYGDFVRRYIAN